MFDNRGGSTQELSIYSILTILVLTSISGGCMFKTPTRGLRVESKDAANAAVLITSFAFENWSNSPKTGRYLHEESILYIDGVKVLDISDDGARFSVLWAEVAPGHHNILIDIFLPQVNLGQGLQKAWTYHTTLAIEMDAEASRIYQIIPNVSHSAIPIIIGHEKRNFDVRLEVKEVVGYKYDSTTEFANHSTNSQLSFRLHSWRGREGKGHILNIK